MFAGTGSLIRQPMNSFYSPSAGSFNFLNIYSVSIITIPKTAPLCGTEQVSFLRKLTTGDRNFGFRKRRKMQNSRGFTSLLSVIFFILYSSRCLRSAALPCAGICCFRPQAVHSVRLPRQPCLPSARRFYLLLPQCASGVQ